MCGKAVESVPSLTHRKMYCVIEVQVPPCTSTHTSLNNALDFTCASNVGTDVHVHDVHVPSLKAYL